MIKTYLSIRQSANRTPAHLRVLEGAVGITVLQRLIAVSLLLAISFVLSHSAIAQTTVLWVGTDGGGDGISYNDADNWDGGIVPLNSGGTQYKAVIPDGVTVNFNVPGNGHEVFQLLVGTGATLKINPGRDLVVVDEANVDGLVISNGGSFIANSTAAVFPGGQGDLESNGGGTIVFAAPTYTSTHQSHGDFFRADGVGSTVDASSLINLSFGPSGGRWTKSITAASGLIDLSGLSSLSVTSGQDDLLDFHASSGGEIDLSGLRSINQTAGNGSERVRFFVGNGVTQSTPSLETGSYTEYRVAQGGTMNLGDQTSGGTDLTLTKRAEFVMEPGATVNAPNLTAVDYGFFVGGTLSGGKDDSQPLPTGSVVNAPRLSNVRRGTIHVNDNATLVTAPLSQIDDARIWTSGGVTFDRITDTDYLSTNHWGSTDIMRARDAGTVLNVSSLQTMTFGPGGGRYVYSVRAEDGGRIDLSGLSSLSVTSGQDDLLDFHASSGGEIDLSNLRSINQTAGNDSERVRFYVGDGSTLPLGDQASGGAGLTASHAQFHPDSGGMINAPNLTAADASIFTGGSTTWRTGEAGLPLPSGSVTNAPRLTNVARSTIHLNSNATLVTSMLTEIDDARIWVSGGVNFDRIIDTDYVTDTFHYDTDLLRAKNANTVLNASSLQSLAFGYSSYRATYGIRAEDGARIDLSGLSSVSVTAGQDDILNFHLNSGGEIDLSGLRSINQTAGNDSERVILNVGGGSTLELGDQTPAGVDLSASHTLFRVESAGTVSSPNITTAKSSFFTGDGTTWRTGDAGQPLPSGSVISAPRLSNVYRSTIHISDNATLETAPLSQIDGARIWVSGGVDFDRIVDTDYVTDTFLYDTDLLRAKDANTVLNASSLQSLTFGYSSYRSTYGIRAEDGARIDLSGLTSVGVKAGQDDILNFHLNSGGEIDLSGLRSINQTAGNGNERVRFFVGEQSMLRLGNLAVADHTEIHAQHLSSEIEVEGSLFLESTSMMTLVEGARVSVGGDFLYRQQDESQMVVEDGIIHANGSGMQFLEAGGLDTGTDGLGANNFGIGQLEIGVEGTPTTVHVLDLFDNGNRGDNEFESLYLDGVGGDNGLLIHTGSLLVLNDVNVYARLDGTMVDLRAMFGDLVDDTEVSAVPFQGGFLALSAPLVGDYDFDGDVDGADFLAFQRGFGSTTNLASDGNRDGVVNAADYTIWRDGFAGFGAAIATNNAVPEPASLVLAILFAGGLFSTRPCRTKNE